MAVAPVRSDMAVLPAIASSTPLRGVAISAFFEPLRTLFSIFIVLEVPQSPVEKGLIVVAALLGAYILVWIAWAIYSGRPG
ncbi:hypothetical protein [Natronosalvus vescus]|uniref:hypothetical protein n=1 Tax=Natronosalvus vescus TaxID=2953881 RepID=UPI0020903F64|nr:hypothetical protein [Natronosalvus vescus]